MKLRQTPGGTWCGTEKDYKAAMKAEGIDLKTYTGRVFVEVPIDKAGLMEFLTFHNVNVISPGTLPGAEAAGGVPLPPTQAAPPAAITTVSNLDDLFLAAPLGQQLTLAAIACENGFQAALQKVEKAN